VEYVNPGFVRVTGYQIHDVIGQNVNILKSKEMPPSLYEELWSTIKSGKEWRGEIRTERKPASSTGSPLQYPR
jgi:PAS domain S-box-containing protein